MKEYKKGDQEYTDFVKSGLNVGFTDDQIDFLWSWFETPPVLETHTVKEPCGHKKSTLSKSTKHGTRKICNNCGQDWKNEWDVTSPSNSEKEECCVCVEGGEGGMFPGCPCKCHKEEIKEDTKKECGCAKAIALTEKTHKEKHEPVKKPSEIIRELRDRRKESEEFDDIDNLFGHESRLVKAIIQYLDETK